jgi:hypothetical protein
MSAESLHTEILSALRRILADITGNPDIAFDRQIALIGAEAEISSREFVEFALAVEDHFDETYGVRFDWTSDSALSAERSIFRSGGALLDHLVALAGSPDGR